MNIATTEDVAALRAQLDLVLAALAAKAPTEPVKPPASYGIEDAAKLLGRSIYTVREWCRMGQCNAFKLPGWKAGKHDRWLISHEEVERIKSEGLLEVDASRNKGKTGPGRGGR